MYEKNNNSVKFTNKNISKTTVKNVSHLIYAKSLIVLVPPLAAILCYLNGLSGDFVHDDVFAIKQNPDVFGGSRLSSVFKNDYWGTPMADRKSHKSYRPLTVLTFRLNFELTGKDPFYFHLVNCLLHVLVTCLFTYTCRHVLNLTTKCSVICATLFAVHPIHTEAVTGIVGRADLLATVLFLLSFISYTKSLTNRNSQTAVIRSHPLFVSSLVLAALSMLLKENGVTALGVCALYDVGVICKREILSCIKTKQISAECKPLAYRIVCISTTVFCLSLFRMWIMNGELPIFQVMDNPASFEGSFMTRWLSFSFIWSYNAWLLLAPVSLCYDWQTGSIPLVTSIYDLRCLATLMFMFVFMVFVFVSLRNINSVYGSRTPNIPFICLILTIVPFLPASNIFFRVGFVLAERILYIASLGYCLCVGVGLKRLTERYRKYEKLLLTCFILMLVLLATKTYNQNKIWRSRQSLFRSGVQAIPHNAKAHYNYANYLKDAGQRADAIDHYRETLRLRNNYAQAHNNLGTLLDNTTEAEFHFLTTLQMSPKHIHAHINLGNLYFKTGEHEKGLLYLNKAVLIDGTNPDALTSLATCFIETGSYEDAGAILKRVLDSNPEYVDAHVSYGALLSKLGKHAEAAEFYQKAYQLDKSRDSALVHATSEYKKLGDLDTAEALLKQVVSQQKEPSAYEQLATLYYHTGRTAQSLDLFDEMSRLFPNTTEIMLKYAKVLANTNDFERATTILQSILSTQPDNVEARWSMALVYSREQNHRMAIEDLDRSIAIAEASQHTDLAKMYADRAENYKDLGEYEAALKQKQSKEKQLCGQSEKKDYQRALKNNNNDVLTHTNMGAIYHVYRQFGEAEYHYREALKIQPGNHLVLDNLNKLRNLKSQTKSGNG